MSKLYVTELLHSVPDRLCLMWGTLQLPEKGGLHRWMLVCSKFETEVISIVQRQCAVMKAYKRSCRGKRRIEHVCAMHDVNGAKPHTWSMSNSTSEMSSSLDLGRAPTTPPSKMRMSMGSWGGRAACSVWDCSSVQECRKSGSCNRRRTTNIEQHASLYQH